MITRDYQMSIVQGAFTISPIHDRPLQIGERMEEDEEEKEEEEQGEEVFLTSTSSGLQLYGGLHNP